MRVDFGGAAITYTPASPEPYPNLTISSEFNFEAGSQPACTVKIRSDRTPEGDEQLKEFLSALKRAGYQIDAP